MTVASLAKYRAERQRARRRRAQLDALAETTGQIRAHIKRAVELDQAINATRLAEALDRWLSTVDAVAKEER